MIIEFDAKEWEKLCTDFIGLTDLTCAQLVTRMAKGVTRRMMLATPPFQGKTDSDPKGKGMKNTSLQKKLGENAIRRDVSFMFPLARQFPAIKNGSDTGKRLLALVEQGRYTEATTMVRRMNLMDPKFFAGFAPRVERSWHLARRDKFIGDKNPRYRHKIESRSWFISDEQARNAYIEQQLRQVGRAKSGWKMAAKRLKVRLPAWVNRHSEPGIFQGIKDKSKPTIVVANPVPYVQYIATRKGNMIAGMEQWYRDMMVKELDYYHRQVNSGATTLHKLREKVKRDSAFTATEVSGEDTSDEDIRFWSK